MDRDSIQQAKKILKLWIDRLPDNPEELARMSDKERLDLFLSPSISKWEYLSLLHFLDCELPKNIAGDDRPKDE